MDEQVWNFMEHYPWEGNVRELKNIFERCFLFSQGNILEKHVELAPVEREARPESGDCIYLKDLKKGTDRPRAGGRGAGETIYVGGVETFRQ